MRNTQLTTSLINKDVTIKMPVVLGNKQPALPMIKASLFISFSAFYVPILLH